MRILILGAGGAVGTAVARVAVAMKQIDTLVLADRDAGALARIADLIAGDRVPGQASVQHEVIDVEDSAALRALLRDVDVVVNTVGPYYRFGVEVLRAAIDTRTDYLDVCDDWEPTLAMLELNENAAAAGVTAVVGVGASPGLASLLAKQATQRLDRVHNIYTAWPVDVSNFGGTEDDGSALVRVDGAPTAAAVHWMQQISGQIQVVEQGQVVSRAPLQPVQLALPGGKMGTAYTVGHPEPLTLHQTFKPAGASACLMVVTTGMVGFLKVLGEDIDGGRLTNETAAAALASPSVRHLTKAAIRSARLSGPGTLPSFFAVAEGLSDGVRTTVLAQLAEEAQALPAYGHMAQITAIPCAIVLSHLAEATLHRPGVHPPEAVVDASRFFAQLDQLTGWNRPQASVSIHTMPTSVPASPKHA